MFITLAPQLFDIGMKYFAVLSPVNCAAVKSVNTISSASARYYELATVADIDLNLNGYVDSTENVVGVTPVKVNYSKGWTCIDLPTSWNWKKDSANYWTYP